MVRRRRPRILAIAGDIAVEVDQGLHRALAEGRLANDDGTPIILHGGGEDLRGGGAIAIDQDRQRPAIGRPGGDIALDLHLAKGVLDLHHRALVDKEAGEVRCLRQGATTIAAQVYHDAIHGFALEVFDELLDIAGGAAEIFIAIGLGAKIAVEARHLQDTDAQPSGIGQVFQHIGLGGLVLQLDLVAHQGDGRG